MNISKTAILPIVTIICGGIAVITGHPIGKDTVDMVATIGATVIGAGISIYGVIKNHKKPAPAQPQVEAPQAPVAQPAEAPQNTTPKQ
jgi:hypothetical protein